MKLQFLLPLGALSLLASCSAADEPKPTAADLVGPDGLIYPDFSRAGVPGGIPNVPQVVKAADFGAIPNDEEDDSLAIQKAVDAASEKGGAVIIGAGTFVFDQTVKIEKNGIVIRGAGRDQTRIVPRFEGQALDKSFPAPHVQAFLFTGKQHPQRVRQELTAPVHRGDLSVEVKDGKGFLPGEVIHVSARKIPADILEILSPKLRAIHQAALKSSIDKNYFNYEWRQNNAVVTKVEGNTLFLDRPLRDELALDLWPFADMNGLLLRGGGIESLTIEQSVPKIQIDAIRFERTYGCWVKDVAVRKIGSWPLGFYQSTNFEVRNVEFDDMWARGGAEGYFGLNMAYDGLVENSTFRNLRHLSVSDRSTGNVFRNCHLENVDINFHLGFPGETLFEKCVVDEAPAPGQEGRGSYGWGIYTPRYTGDIHMPSGGRHIFWGNDIHSRLNAIMLGGGGSSEMTFAYNRFVNDAGPAIMIKKRADNNLFFKNVFASRDYTRPLPAWFQQYYGVGDIEPASESRESGGVVFMSAPATGNRFVDNSFYGVPLARLIVGEEDKVESENNTANLDFTVPNAPSTPMPSLLEWEKAQHRKAQP